ncbi:MAG: ABC-type Fe3+ transport system, periplasmic component [Glaciihabitans sp.]|nr:ABC-type Fe3+ transport system, periplasmic component [Glaciihabitans sp.]
MSKTRTPVVIAGLVSAALLTMTGCSSAPSTSDGGTSTPAVDGSTLVVYTNSNSDGRGEWWTEEAQAAGFDIQIVGAGGGDVVNKLVAEKNRPVADVVFGLNNMYFSQLNAEGLVSDYTPSWSDEVDETLGDTEGEAAYWPLVQQASVLIYDEAAYSAADAPTSWTELATDFSGAYEVPNQSGLGGATTQLILAGILSEFKDDDGDLGISDEGWETVAELFANGIPSETDVPLLQRMSDGTVTAGQMYSSGILGFEEQFGVQVAIVAPSEGVPFAIEQVGVVAGTSKAAEAEKFIDWMGSGEVQGEFAAQFDAAPVNEIAVQHANPEALALVTEVKPQDVDYAWASENMGDWVEKITLEYLQ